MRRIRIVLVSVIFAGVAVITANAASADDGGTQTGTGASELQQPMVWTWRP